MPATRDAAKKTAANSHVPATDFGERRIEVKKFIAIGASIFDEHTQTPECAQTH
jgi:hypothetical protein